MAWAKELADTAADRIVGAESYTVMTLSLLPEEGITPEGLEAGEVRNFDKLNMDLPKAKIQHTNHGQVIIGGHAQA
jgi:hypothetical protein